MHTAGRQQLSDEPPLAAPHAPTGLTSWWPPIRSSGSPKSDARHGGGSRVDLVHDRSRVSNPSSASMGSCAPPPGRLDGGQVPRAWRGTELHHGPLERPEAHGQTLFLVDVALTDTSQDLPAAGRSSIAGRVEVDARSGDAHEMREVEQVAHVAPAEELRQRVRAGDEMQLDVLADRHFGAGEVETAVGGCERVADRGLWMSTHPPHAAAPGIGPGAPTQLHWPGQQPRAVGPQRPVAAIRPVGRRQPKLSRGRAARRRVRLLHESGERASVRRRDLGGRRQVAVDGDAGSDAPDASWWRCDDHVHLRHGRAWLRVCQQAHAGKLSGIDAAISGARRPGSFGRCRRGAESALCTGRTPVIRRRASGGTTGAGLSSWGRPIRSFRPAPTPGAHGRVGRRTSDARGGTGCTPAGPLSSYTRCRLTPTSSTNTPSQRMTRWRASSLIG